MTDCLAQSQKRWKLRTLPAYWSVRSILAGALVLFVCASGRDLFAQRGFDRSRGESSERGERDSRGEESSRDRDDDRGSRYGGRSGSERGRPSFGGREGGYGGPGGSGYRGGDSRGSSGRSSSGGFGEFLKRMDANGDGSLDPAEIPERMRPMIDRMAAGTKIDPKRPIKISALEEAMASTRERMMSGRGDDRGSSRSRSGSDSRRGDSKSDSKSNSSNSDAAPLVPGFGEPSDLAAVPGFGVAVAEDDSTQPRDSRDREDDSDRGDRGRSDRLESSAGSSSAGSSPRASSGSSGSSAPTDKADRVRQYAASRFKSFDADKDGFLNKGEISANPAVSIAADSNGDGLISAAEFETHMLSRNGVSSGLSSTGTSGGSSLKSDSGSEGRSRYGRSRGSRDSDTRDSDRGRDSFGRNSRSSRDIPTALAPLATINGQPTRFMTATERLPEGLPSWFALKDLDADGQVSMAEYSKTWSEAKLREYAEIDSNNDGVITPAECLADSDREER